MVRVFLKEFDVMKQNMVQLYIVYRACRTFICTAKIYRMQLDYTVDDVCEAILTTIRVNNLNACYIRPVVFRGYGSLGVDPLTCPVEFVIAVWEWGQYLGDEALRKGVSVCGFIVESSGA